MSAIRSCQLRSFLFYFIAIQILLIANEQFAVGEDRMRPGRLAGARRRETAVLDVLLRVGLDQDDRPALIAIVQATVGVSDRSLTGLALAPLHLARHDLQTRQPALVGAVQVIAEQNHAAVMVLHVLGEVDFLGLYLVAVARQLGQSAAGAVGGRGENVAVAIQRRRA